MFSFHEETFPITSLTLLCPGQETGIFWFESLEIKPEVPAQPFPFLTAVHPAAESALLSAPPSCLHFRGSSTLGRRWGTQVNFPRARHLVLWILRNQQGVEFEEKSNTRRVWDFETGQAVFLLCWVWHLQVSLLCEAASFYNGRAERWWDRLLTCIESKRVWVLKYGLLLIGSILYEGWVGLDLSGAG